MKNTAEKWGSITKKPKELPGHKMSKFFTEGPRAVIASMGSLPARGHLTKNIFFSKHPGARRSLRDAWNYSDNPGPRGCCAGATTLFLGRPAVLAPKDPSPDPGAPRSCTGRRRARASRSWGQDSPSAGSVVSAQGTRGQLCGPASTITCSPTPYPALSSTRVGSWGRRSRRVCP